jgi:hypothetical protein
VTLLLPKFVGCRAAHPSLYDMLAGYLDVTLPARPDAGYGMMLDPETNAITELAEGGVAMMSGIIVGDLCVMIDDTIVTNFDAKPGPVEGTLLVQSGPQNILPVQQALTTGAQSHTMRLLRLIDPDTLPSPSPAEGQGGDQQLQADPEHHQHLLREFEAQAQAQARYASNPGMSPHEQYPWAGDISVPDETFGARGGLSLKSKYNLKPGTELPPVQNIISSHDSELRKTMLISGRPSLFMKHQQ